MDDRSDIKVLKPTDAEYGMLGNYMDKIGFVG